MYDLLGQVFGTYMGIREAFTFPGNLAHIDSLFRTVLNTAQATNAVRTETGFPAGQADVIPWTDLHTGTTAYAGVIGCKFPDSFGVCRG